MVCERRRTGVSGAGPLAFDLQTARHPGVHCTPLVRQITGHKAQEENPCQYSASSHVNRPGEVARSWRYRDVSASVAAAKVSPCCCRNRRIASSLRLDTISRSSSSLSGRFVMPNAKRQPQEAAANDDRIQVERNGCLPLAARSGWPIAVSLSV